MSKPDISALEQTNYAYEIYRELGSHARRFAVPGGWLYQSRIRGTYDQRWSEPIFVAWVK